MQVRIVLDHPYTVWTNLDFIKGKVLLNIPSLTGNINSIVVKLEGESRTKLLPTWSGNQDEVVKPRVEIHKILYKVAQVFPSARAIQDGLPPRGPYTLSNGQYEYPFEFKIPFNNDCQSNLLKPPSLKVLVSDAPKEPTLHVKKTLPPSLNSFPGVADVRYFVKVTVNRREFYKENPRYLLPFNFIPIEPPRPPQTGAESYARRQHQFSATPGKKGFFGDRRRPNTLGSDGPSISVDARLPNPPILTCSSGIPLRILVKRLNNSSEHIFLESLQIKLIGHSTLTAHDVTERKDNQWVITNLTNMGILLGTAEGNINGPELVVDSKPWSNKILPNSVAPSFETCNITRQYELEVRVGLGNGHTSSKNTIIFPLLLPVQVYSGIAPPASLLAAMQTPTRRKPIRPSISTNQVPQTPSSETPVSASIYHTPTSPQAGPSALTPTIPLIQRPAQVSGSAGFAPQPTGPDEPSQALVEDPPPSYEDAIAQDLPPIDGPRRDYGPPNAGDESGTAFEIDVGKGGRRRS